MQKLKQQDVCDMEVDLAEVMWQESDATIWNTLAHELETLTECLPAEKDDVEDIEMPGDELRDESEFEEQAPMEDEEQRDGSVAEHEGHSKQDLNLGFAIRVFLPSCALRLMPKCFSEDVWRTRSLSVCG